MNEMNEMDDFVFISTTSTRPMYITYVDDYCKYCYRMLKQTDTECPGCGAPKIASTSS
jgi:hypothetical protein